MEDLFFVDDSVAGRCGPDKVLWDLDALRKAGVTAILSVNDGEMVHVSRLNSMGICYEHIPLSSNAPPKDGDLEFCLTFLPKIVEFITEHKKTGTVVVHCKSGKDRTCLALAAYFVLKKGLSIVDAIKHLKKIRPIAFTAPGWGEFAMDVLSGLNAHNT